MLAIVLHAMAALALTAPWTRPPALPSGGGMGALSLALTSGPVGFAGSGTVAGAAEDASVPAAEAATRLTMAASTAPAASEPMAEMPVPERRPTAQRIPQPAVPDTVVTVPRAVTLAEPVDVALAALPENDALPSDVPPLTGETAMPTPERAASDTVRPQTVARVSTPSPASTTPTADEAHPSAPPAGAASRSDDGERAGDGFKTASMEAAQDVSSTTGTGGGPAEPAGLQGGAAARADFMRALRAWLERHKEYPARARSRRQQGVVLLNFTIDRAGAVLGFRIARSSGHRLLDRAVERLIRRAQPLPSLPGEWKLSHLELQVPIRFSLR